MPRARRSGIVGWAAALAVTVAASAAAQVPGEEIARRAFEEGVVLEKKGDYTAALAKFNESRQVKPTLGNRFHAAYCLEMLGRIALALTEYESVDVAAREQNKRDVIEATRARMEPLQKRVAQLGVRLAGDAPGAEVLLDGAAVPAALLDGKPFRVDPGDHRVVAQAPAHDLFTKELTLAEGASATVEVVLTKTAAPPAPPPVSEHRPAGADEVRRPLPGAAIATTAIAGSLAVGGIAAFVVAGDVQSDARATCPSRRTCDDERERVRTFDALALAGFVGAAGLGALSVYLWTRKPGRASHRIVIRPGLAAAAIEGRF